MAPLLDQTTTQPITGVGSATSLTFTFTAQPKAGSTVFVFTWGNFGGSPTAVDDNAAGASNSYTLDSTNNNGSLYCFIYRANNISLPASGNLAVTVHLAAAHTIDGGAASFTGVTPGAPEATGNASIASSSTTYTSASVGSSLGELFLGDSTINGGVTGEGLTTTSPVGAVQLFVENNSANFYGTASYYVGDGPQSFTWTESPVIPGLGVDTIAAYTAAPAGSIGRIKRPRTYELHNPRQRWRWSPRRYPILGPAGQLFLQELDVVTTTAPSLNKTAGKALSVSTTSSPSLVKQVGKGLSVTTTTGVSLIRQVGKALSVTTTTFLLLLKSVGKLIQVSTTTTPALVAAKVKVVILALTTTTMVSLTKTVGKLVLVTTTTTSSLLKQIGKLLSYSTATTPSLAAQKVKVIILAVTSTTTAALTKQIGKLVSLTTTTTPVLTKTVGKLLALTSATSPSLTRRIGKLLAVTTTTTAALTTIKARLVSLAITTTTQVVLLKQIGKNLAVSTSIQPVLTRVISKTLILTTTTVPRLSKQIGKTLAANAASQVVLTVLKNVVAAATRLRYYLSSQEPPTQLATDESLAAGTAPQPSAALSSSEAKTSLEDREPPSGQSSNVRGQ